MATRGAERRAHASVIPAAWRLAEALARQPGLTLVPTASQAVRLEGDLRCHAVGPAGVLVDERYRVAIEVPRTFPRDLPRVVESQGRIPRSFHHLADGALCLGSPIAQTLAIAAEPTVGAFIDRVVVPYLYGHAFHARFGRMPYGELAHGAAGLADDVRRQFRLPSRTCAEEFLRLAGLKRRHANKRPCPCRSGRRVGRCHGAAVHVARRRLGRHMCREQRVMLVRHRILERSS